MHRNNKRFTLVEMLVVISILAILAAMVSPALMNAMNASRRVECMNNQRQTITALHVYASDNRNIIPVVSPFNAGVRGWMMVLNDNAYLSWESMMCPSITEGKTKNAAGKYSVWDTTYGIIIHEGINATFRNSAGDLFRSSLSQAPDYSRIYIYLANAKAASRSVLLADTIKLGSCATPGRASYRWRRDAPSENGGVSNIHTGQVNCAFIDGHVSPLIPELLSTTASIIKYYVDFNSLTGEALP